MRSANQHAEVQRAYRGGGKSVLKIMCMMIFPRALARYSVVIREQSSQKGGLLPARVASSDKKVRVSACLVMPTKRVTVQLNSPALKLRPLYSRKERSKVNYRLITEHLYFVAVELIYPISVAINGDPTTAMQPTFLITEPPDLDH